MEYYCIVSALPAVLWMAVILLTAFHGQGSTLRGRRLRTHLEWAGLDVDEIEYRMRVPCTGCDSDVATTEAAIARTDAAWVVARQGDLVWTNSKPEHPERGWADLNRCAYSPEPMEVTGRQVAFHDGTETVVVSHPDHPSIRLPLWGPYPCIWAQQASRSVVPSRLGGAD